MKDEILIEIVKVNFLHGIRVSVEHFGKLTSNEARVYTSVGHSVEGVCFYADNTTSNTTSSVSTFN